MLEETRFAAYKVNCQFYDVKHAKRTKGFNKNVTMDFSSKAKIRRGL